MTLLGINYLFKENNRLKDLKNLSDEYIEDFKYNVSNNLMLETEYKLWPIKLK